MPCETVSGGAGGFVAGGLVAGGLVTGGVVAGGKVAAGTVVGGRVVEGVVTGGKVAAGAVAVGAFAGGLVADGFPVAGAVAEGAVATGAVAEGAVAPGAFTGADVPVVRGAGVAAVGWANVVSVAARSMLVASGATVAGALPSGEVVDGGAVVEVDALTDEVGASAAAGAGTITVSAGAAAAGAAAGASCWAACLADTAAASAWAMRAAPPRVAEMLAPATVIFEAKPMMGRRRCISATCLQCQDEQRQGGGEQHCYRCSLPKGALQIGSRSWFRRCINSVHASLSAGR